MTIKRRKIIVVDDNPTDLVACKNILNPFYEVYPAPSVAKLLEMLSRFLPDLILLDVVMSEIDGYETARLLKNNNAYKEVPIIFLTARSDTKSEILGLDLGAVDYIHKPFVGPLFLRRIEMHLTLIDHKKELVELNESMHKMLMQKVGQLWRLQNAVMTIVTDLVETRHNATGGHISRTQKYLSCLVNKLIEENLYADETSSWNLDYVLPSAQLHDVGKIGIPDTILDKTAKLTKDEFEVIKTHVPIGMNAITRMEKAAEDHSFFHHAKIFVGTHHEKWNGTGYPNGLKETEIPLEGRLMAIADVYDALVSVRPYKPAFTPKKAASIIKEGKGEHFDPQLVDIFSMVSDQFAEMSQEDHV
ncbi:MAG: response regulator [Firmicutes bacterium]|nr:response regulator [Bacillota bacterium]